MKIFQEFSFLIILMILCFSILSSSTCGQMAEICIEPPIRNVKGHREFEVFIWIRLIPDPGLTSVSLAIMWNSALMTLQDTEILLPEGWEVIEEISGKIQNKEYFFMKLQNTQKTNYFDSINCDRKWLHLTFRCEGKGKSAIEISKSMMTNGSDGTKIVGTELKNPLKNISYEKFDCSIKQFGIDEESNVVAKESNSTLSISVFYLVLTILIGIIIILIIKRKVYSP